MATKSTTVNAAAKLARASQKAYTHKWSFIAVVLLVLFITVCFAAIFDILPDSSSTQKADASSPVSIASTTALVLATTAEEPNKITIPAIKLSATISNPASTDIEVLDNALLTGAVRYPTSAQLGQPGNVILFGHSSYLPIVHNQAYKTFDGIQNLKEGDRIYVTGSGHSYVYSVEQVGKASATSDSIPLSVEGSKLTLATCDSFGEKTDRFIVIANLVETDPL